MFVVLAGLMAVPKIIELANRVLEDYVIPDLIKKKAKKSLTSGGNVEDLLYPYGFDVALTPKDLRKLREIGAFEIINRGVSNHYSIASQGKAKLCECCKRLST